MSTDLDRSALLGAAQRSGRLAGRVAVVTGGSRGIGRAIAAEFVAQGARVVLTSRHAAAAEEAAAAIGVGAVGLAAHVSDESAARRCLQAARDTFGPVNILVNNVASNPAYGPILDQDYGRFTKLMELNLWGPIMWTALAVEAGLAESRGCVINMASIGGYLTGPDSGLYHISKGALIHLTKQLAVELAPDVRVNAIAPGVVKTRFSEIAWKGREAVASAGTPLGRLGEPGDVARAALYLASEDSTWVTGTTLVVDGGQLVG